MINPGELNKRIIFQKKIEDEGPFQSLDDNEDYVKVWSKVTYLRGRNLYAARAANIKTDAEFLIRRRKDLDEKMRIKFTENGTDRYFGIEGIVPYEKDRMFLTVTAHEVKYDM